MYKTQRGLSLIGFLFLGLVAFFIAMLAMKLVPAYIEFFSVKKILSSMAQDSALKTMSNNEIRSSFSKRAQTGYVNVVKPEDLTIERTGGSPVISVEYEYRAPLVADISLVVDFKASTDATASQAVE